MYKIISKSDSGQTTASKIIMLVGTMISSVPYGFFFSWIFFIVGFIFVWNSDMKKKEKWFWTIIPLTIWLPIMILIFFLIPLILNGFRIY